MHSKVLTLMIVLALLVVPACSGGDRGDSGGGQAETTAGTPAAEESSRAFVDVVECEPQSGTGTSSGTIENTSTEATAYELTIGFYDAQGKQLATASVTTEVAAAGATVDWSASAAGVGDVSSEDLTCRTVSVQPTAPAGGTSTSSASTAQGDDDFPCDLVPATAIAQITGNPLDGDAISGDVTEADKTWTARTCVWTAIGAADAQEVTIAVSRPADFPAGASTCPPPVGTTTVVNGLGSSATWSWTDAGTTTKVGELRVCSPAALVAVRVSGPGGEGEQQQVASNVAAAALGGL